MILVFLVEVVEHQLFDSQTTISVADSKEGWAKALRQLIALLYSGEVAKYDLNRIRPAGARLKTFGGRASGPGPLDDEVKFHTLKRLCYDDQLMMEYIN